MSQLEELSSVTKRGIMKAVCIYNLVNVYEAIRIP